MSDHAYSRQRREARSLKQSIAAKAAREYARRMAAQRDAAQREQDEQLTAWKIGGAL